MRNSGGGRLSTNGFGALAQPFAKLRVNNAPPAAGRPALAGGLGRTEKLVRRRVDRIEAEVEVEVEPEESTGAPHLLE